MQCCWLPAWLIVPESIDWTTLAVHWADETLRIPGVVICVDNSITFKCFDNFPCGKLVLHRTLCEELFRVLEKCFVFCFLCFTKSVLNWFYISYQHAVTSWFADISSFRCFENHGVQMNPERIVLNLFCFLLFYEFLVSFFWRWEVLKLGETGKCW